MKKWRVNFAYDHKPDDVIEFDTLEADGPDEAMAKIFSTHWDHIDTTSDGVLSCFHYRMKDAHVTVYVWEVE